MEVYLIRHTKPQIGKGICYGQTNIPLMKSFHKEAKVVATTLPKNIDIVFSSPLSRCMQLAKYIPAKNFISDKRLLEMNFGDWEMEKWDAIDQTILSVWMKYFVTMRVPNGENFIDLYNRVNSFFNELTLRNYKKVAIVTHAGVIRCLVAKLLELPYSESFTISVEYSSVKKLLLNADGTLNKVLV